MIVLETRNANQSAICIARMLLEYGIEKDGRVCSPEPVTVIQFSPWERLPFIDELQINPFAEMVKSLWSLCGRVELNLLAKYHHPDVALSENGQTLRGAYGYRTRDHFVLYPDEDSTQPYPAGQIDQLLTVIDLLKSDPERTDCVIQLWDAGYDLGLAIMDRPCATQIYVRINPLCGGLDLTVCYRECDIQQAATDSITFTMMQSFIAESLETHPGKYYQIFQVVSAAETRLDSMKDLTEALYQNPYEDFPVKSRTLACIEPAAFMAECQTFLDEGVVLGMRDKFLRKTVEPMMRAWKSYMNQSPQTLWSAALIAEDIYLIDWRVACVLWLEPKHGKVNKKMKGKVK